MHIKLLRHALIMDVIVLYIILVPKYSDKSPTQILPKNKNNKSTPYSLDVSRTHNMILTDKIVSASEESALPY